VTYFNRNYVVLYTAFAAGCWWCTTVQGKLKPGMIWETTLPQILTSSSSLTKLYHLIQCKENTMLSALSNVLSAW